MTRDTTTGSNFESIVESCLDRAAKADNFAQIVRDRDTLLTLLKDDKAGKL